MVFANFSDFSKAFGSCKAVHWYADTKFIANGRKESKFRPILWVFTKAIKQRTL
jgi:hypothetical protein